MRPTIVALALPLAACGGTTDHPMAEVVDSAGVSLVWNRGADVPLDWRFEPVLTVGGEEDGPEAFYQVGSSAVGVDASGNLYVLDRGNHRVVVFDREGRHVRTMGGKGGGPGELQWPHSLVVTAEGIVGAADIGKRGLVRYGPDGAVLEQRPLEGWSGGALRSTDDGIVAELRRREGETQYEDVALLTDDSARVLVSAQSPPLRPADFGCVKMSGMAALFAPSMVWSAGGNRIAVAPGAAYVVDLYERGEQVASVRRDVALRPVTEDLAIREAGDGLSVQFAGPGAGGKCTAPPEDVVEQQGYADVIPAVSQVALAPDGTLWVRRREVRGDPQPVDLFTAAGQYMGTVPPGSPFPAAFTPDGGIVVVELDDLDVPRVMVYRIVGADMVSP